MASGVPARTPRRRYHFHFPGVVYVLVTLLIAVGAINSQNNLLFAALGLAIGGLLVSGVISGSALLGISLERSAAPHAAVGQPLKLRYRVSNTNRLIGAFVMHIDEQIGDKSNWNSFLPFVRAFVTHVPAGRTSTGEAEVIPERRGIATFNAVQVWSKFPFGLARKSITIASPMSMIVHPPELPLRPGLIARIRARAPYGVGGERHLGMGDEFFGLREYIPGDSTKLIAWKRSARSDALLVRQQATPTPTKLWVVVRFGRAADAAVQRGLDERAIALAAAILREATAGGVSVGLAIPRAAVMHTPRTGRWHLDRLLGDLAVVDARAEGAADDRLPESAARTGACVVIHSGALDESYGPRGAIHLSAARTPDYFQPGPEIDRILELFDRSAQRSAQSHRRKPVRLTSFLRPRPEPAGTPS